MGEKTDILHLVKALLKDAANALNLRIYWLMTCENYNLKYTHLCN